MNLKFGEKEFVLERKYLIIIAGIILAIVIFLFLFRNGKNKNQLYCTLIDSNVSANTEERITMNFKNNKLSSMETYYKNAPTGDFLYMLQDIYDNYNSQMMDLKKADGYDYTIELGTNYVVSKVTIDIDAISDDTEANNRVKDAIGFNNTWTYKDAKANLEEHNFKCK